MYYSGLIVIICVLLAVSFTVISSKKGNLHDNTIFIITFSNLENMMHSHWIPEKIDLNKLLCEWNSLFILFRHMENFWSLGQPQSVSFNLHEKYFMEWNLTTFHGNWLLAWKQKKFKKTTFPFFFLLANLA